MGGAVAAVESSYMKQQLVESNTRRLDSIERGEQVVVGVNRYTETEASPLATGQGAILTVPEEVEAGQIARLKAWRDARDAGAVASALGALKAAAASEQNLMPASIAAAQAGVTTGEWGAALREVFGEYRAPTGVSGAAAHPGEGLDRVRAEVDRVSR